MKIVTLAAAAEKLGWDYTYETRVFAAGSVNDGVLNEISSSSAPAIRVWSPPTAWRIGVRRLGPAAEAGRHPRGQRRVVGDDNGFEKETLGSGWMWDDLPDDYFGRRRRPCSTTRTRSGIMVMPGPAAGDAPWQRRV